MNSEQPFTTQNQTDSYTPSPEASLSPTVKVHGEVPPTNVYEVEAKPVVNTEVKTERQPEQPQPPQESKSNSALTRLLVGGLVGGTLGTLAAALANRKTSKGFNHSAEGVGRAFKTIGQGLGQAAQGVGEAAKSVSEGVTYAVVGSAQDITEGTQQLKSTTTGVVYSTTAKVNQAVKDTAAGITEGAEQVKSTAAEAIQSTTEQVNQAVKGAAAGITEGAQQVKSTTTEAIQSTTEQINQAVKDIAEGSQRSMSDPTVEKPVVLADAKAVMDIESETAYISAIEEPVLEMGDELDVIEAETVIRDDWQSEAEMQDDVIDSTSSNDFIQEDITLSSQPYSFPEVETIRPNDQSRRR